MSTDNETNTETCARCGAKLRVTHTTVWGHTQMMFWCPSGAADEVARLNAEFGDGERADSAGADSGHANEIRIRNQ